MNNEQQARLGKATEMLLNEKLSLTDNQLVTAIALCRGLIRKEFYQNGKKCRWDLGELDFPECANGSVVLSFLNREVADVCYFTISQKGKLV
jgi:hypothetical protein